MRFSTLAAFALTTVAAAPAFAYLRPFGNGQDHLPSELVTAGLYRRETFSRRLAYARAYDNLARELDLVSRQVLLPGESPDPACVALHLSCK